MPAAKGSECKLYMGDGEVAETFALVGGLQVSGMALECAAPDGSNLSGGPWRTLEPGMGAARVTIGARGLFTATETEQALRMHAFAGTVANFRLTFGSGDWLQGAFRIVRYGRTGDVERLETVELTLESAGTVSYTPADA